MYNIHHCDTGGRGEGDTHGLGGDSDQVVGDLSPSGEDVGHRAGGDSDCIGLDLQHSRELQADSGGYSY